MPACNAAVKMALAVAVLVKAAAELVAIFAKP
jgi:hypothetical protein